VDELEQVDDVEDVAKGLVTTSDDVMVLEVGCWSLGGDRPNLRRISSDFSGFFIKGGGFFFEEPFLLSSPFLISGDTNLLEKLFGVSLVKLLLSNCGVVMSELNFGLVRDVIDIEDEYTDDADSVLDVEHDLSCSLPISGVLDKINSLQVKILVSI
jgi:hypothetical protein